jgi:hypothetical protein
VEEEKADETINPEINPDILRIHAEMSRVIGTAEAAGIEGNIDLVQVCLTLKLKPVCITVPHADCTVQHCVHAAGAGVH